MSPGDPWGVSGGVPRGGPPGSPPQTQSKLKTVTDPGRKRGKEREGDHWSDGGRVRVRKSEKYSEGGESPGITRGVLEAT